MTGRTHDLIAFTALHVTFVSIPLIPMSLGTAVVAFGANFMGGLFPDIDQPTSDMWDNFRGGQLLGKWICKILGGHRHVSHSLLGISLFGFLIDRFLQWIHPVVLIDMTIVWWSFMIGFVSHIIADMPTKEGVPLFWPLKIDIGVPPFRFLRIRSGHFVENFIIFPSFLLVNAYLFYAHYGKWLDFFQHSLR